MPVEILNTGEAHADKDRVIQMHFLPCIGVKGPATIT